MLPGATASALGSLQPAKQGLRVHAHLFRVKQRDTAEVAEVEQVCEPLRMSKIADADVKNLTVVLSVL